MKPLIAALLLAAAGGAAAQDKPPAPIPPAPIPPVSESVEVTVTNIEVVVTDSKGNRVTGLTRDDFEVIQDGRPQPITNFYAVAGGKVTLDDGKVISLESPAEAAEVPQELKTRYVVYIDNLNIQPQNRNRMFKRLKEFIGQTIGKHAEAMVVVYNRSLKVKRNFTSDAGDIVGVLETVELETGSGTTLAGERRDALRAIDESRSPTEALQYARNFARSYRNDLEFAVDAMKSTLNSLAGLSGRKVMIYVSEGVPSTVGLELFDSVQRKFRENTSTLEQFEFDMNSKYASIVQAANAQGVTIWPLDASGLTTDELVTAENRSYSNRPSDFTLRTNTQAPLQMMAEQTGGVAAINTNDWKANLDELAKDFSNFYSIGYRMTRSAVDKPHSLEVIVKRKGLKARARKGFLEKSVETRTAEAVLASLHYPREENPLGISVALGQSKPYDRNNYTIPVRITIPLAKLGLVPSGDRYQGNFIVYFVVLDVSGKQSDLAVQKQAVSVPVKDLQKAQSKDYYYDVSLIVVPGGQKLAVALRDGVTSQTSYVQKNFFVSVLPAEAKKAANN